MEASNDIILPTNIIKQISEEMSGKDLFHFTLATYYYLDITDYHLIKLLHNRPNISLTSEIESLIRMSKSPYFLLDDKIAVVLSTNKWNTFVYGPFTLNIIEKSLKYFCTSVFCLYARLWSFTPFCYSPTYPTLEIFNYSYLLQSRELTVDERALFSVWGDNQISPKLVLNFEQFRENFNARYNYKFWETDIDWNLFVIAGGSVTLSLLKQTSLQKGSDVDLFFLKKGSKLFQQSVSKTFSPLIIMQLIRPTHTASNVSQIIHSFDLDVCAAAFNSKQVTISFACLQALNSGHATCYDMPTSSSQYMRRVVRLLKYEQRGFNILYPKQFDINTFLSTPIEDCKETQPERIYRFRRRHFGDNCDHFSIQKQFCEYYRLN
ncbi:unnamed protein product [Adineta ricciae]|uniref:Uncharacterized protein n=1 Tax=Adineta ricciae TaxID=249248 RepID=A0A815KZL4_ADIRI|nr:unnamed protein product [Adineta ricciae]CAF1402241.1 unnamed protein product [Adineta ricciae]